MLPSQLLIAATYKTSIFALLHTKNSLVYTEEARDQAL